MGFSAAQASITLGRRQQSAEVEEQQKVPIPSPEVSTEPRMLLNPPVGADEPLQHCCPRGAGRITAGMRCAAEPDFPTEPRDPSSCRGSRAEDDPGKTGLTMSLLLCFPQHLLPEGCHHQGWSHPCDLTPCPCPHGRSPSSSGSFGIAQSVPTPSFSHEIFHQTQIHLV